MKNKYNFIDIQKEINTIDGWNNIYRNGYTFIRQIVGEGIPPKFLFEIMKGIK